MKPIVVAISGGSGSGKTTFGKRLQAKLGSDNCSILAQDSYYRDQSEKFDHDGGSVNFDHPDAIEFSLMGEHLDLLSQLKPIEVPVYDFTSHTRQSLATSFDPSPVILVDGILILSQEVVHSRCDKKIYISCDEQIRFERRLRRDTVERGRTPEGVHSQFYSQVKPMHDQFVEPSQKIADLIIEQHLFDEQVDRVYRELLILLSARA